MSIVFPKIKVSVVIPSFNPELKLSDTLDSLVPQSQFIDEVIIIIDLSNYQYFTKAMEEKYATLLKINSYSLENSGRGKSRNRGTELSTGDIIVFLDDDMIAEKDLIEKHIRFHTRKPDSIVSGNGYRNPKGANYDFGKYLIEIESSWKEKTKGIGTVTFQNFNFSACNMSVPIGIFRLLGGFDTRFSDGEDFDFAVRAIQANLPVYYDGTIAAWHNDWPEIDVLIKRQREYTLAKIEIFKIHPGYNKLFPKMIPKQTGALKKILIFLLKKPINNFVNIRNNIFTHFPLKVKFFFYNITIFINSLITDQE